MRLVSPLPSKEDTPQKKVFRNCISREVSELTIDSLQNHNQVTYKAAERKKIRIEQPLRYLRNLVSVIAEKKGSDINTTVKLSQDSTDELSFVHQPDERIKTKPKYFSGRQHHATKEASPFDTIIVTIHAGRNLVAKKRNFMWCRDASDPYVKLRYRNYDIGRTSTVKKTLNPIWGYDNDNGGGGETFQLVVGNEELNEQETSEKMLELSILDHNFLFRDAPMGTVLVPLPTSVNKKIKNWYKVEKGSAEGKYRCNKSTGELSISVELLGPSVVSFRSQGNANDSDAESFQYSCGVLQSSDTVNVTRANSFQWSYMISDAEESISPESIYFD